MPRFPAWTATRRIALAIGAAALVVGLADAASAQTKLKMVLNWKYQGPQGWFFLAAGQGLLQGRRPRRHDRPGRRLGDADPQGRERHLRRRLRRHQRADRLRREEAGRRADRGLCDVQPAALHRRGEGGQPDQDAEGPRGQDLRRRRRMTARSSCSRRLQDRQDRLQQGQDHQHAAEPARADADARPGRRRVRLRQHHPLQRQADRHRSRQADPLHQLRRLRHGPLFQRASSSRKKLVKENPEAVRGFVRALNKAVDRLAQGPEGGGRLPCSSASR